MQKEIFEQPRAVGDTLQDIESVTPELFGDDAYKIFKDIDSVLVPCGTSYYAGLTAKYWIESVAKIPVNVEIASEYRYRDSVPNPRALVVTISQSGETADTLAALKHARSLGMQHTLTICNVATSAMVRECKLVHITRARRGDRRGLDQGLHHPADRLFLLTLALAQVRGNLTAEQEAAHQVAAPPARRHRFGAGAGTADHGLGGPLRLQKTRCSWVAACTIRSRWKARSSSRKSATSTPKPTRQANSSTARWPW